MPVLRKSLSEARPADERRDGIWALRGHDRPAVRHAAVTLPLPWHPDEAVRLLEDMRAAGSFEAIWILKEWRAGTLKLDWWPVARQVVRAVNPSWRVTSPRDSPAGSRSWGAHAADVNELAARDQAELFCVLDELLMDGPTGEAGERPSASARPRVSPEAGAHRYDFARNRHISTTTTSAMSRTISNSLGPICGTRAPLLGPNVRLDSIISRGPAGVESPR